MNKGYGRNISHEGYGSNTLHRDILADNFLKKKQRTERMKDRAICVGFKIATCL